MKSKEHCETEVIELSDYQTTTMTMMIAENCWQKMSNAVGVALLKVCQLFISSIICL